MLFCRLHVLMFFQLQKLLFSATLTRQPELLHPLKLFHPKLFTTVGKSDTSVAHSEPKAKAAVNSSGLSVVLAIACTIFT